MFQTVFFQKNKFSAQGLGNFTYLLNYSLLHYLVSCMTFCLFLSLFSCKNTDKTLVKHLPYYNTPEFTPIFIEKIEDSEKQITHKITDFAFTNQNNQQITQQIIANKIHVANFFFTSCGSICPVMTKNMSKINDVFQNDETVVLLSYTVTPWIDSVARLQEYAQRYEINSKNWHLLTGNKAKIYELARKSYFAEEDIGFSKDSTEFLHTEHFLLVDKNQKIRGIYNGTLALEMEHLIEDIKVLQKE